MSDTTGATPTADAPTSDPGTALCLSGGGFRATLFHVGVIRRLAELGLLDGLDAISSVSGGSITSGALAIHWRDGRLDIDAFETSLFGLAQHTLDMPAVFGGWARFQAVSTSLARLYDRYLFHEQRLADLPDAPTFIFDTTNMHSGNSFQWSKARGHDYAVGDILKPDIALSTIVAASSAFPPVLSPARITPPGPFVEPDTGQPADRQPDTLWLTDGGVYDNLGLQAVDHYETLLISDASAPFVPGAKLRGNWFSLTMRTMSLLQDQIGKRRRYEELYAPGAADRRRLMWSLRRDADSGTATDGLPVTDEQLLQLSRTHTRLAKMPLVLRHRLANLGYALADHQVRPRLRPDAAAPTEFPYPGGLGRGDPRP